MTRGQWAVEFLSGIGAPASKRNMLVMLSWMQAEGSTAAWNPLNTTRDAPGATPLPGNPALVKEYPDRQTGMEASVQTMNWGADHNMFGYREIRHRLRQSQGAIGTLWAIERSDWGTGGLGLACLPGVKLFYKKNRLKPIPED